MAAPSKSTPGKRKPGKAEPSNRQSIIDAARKRFAVSGFDGASTRQIAADADVAQSLLLYHFKSKEELWFAVIADVFGQATELFTGAIAAGVEDDLDTRIDNALATAVRLFATYPEIHLLISLESRVKGERLKWLVKHHLKPGHDATVKLIEEGQKAGILQPGNPTLLYYSTIGILGSIYCIQPEIQLVSKKPPTDGDVIKVLRRLLLVAP